MYLKFLYHFLKLSLFLFLKKTVDSFGSLDISLYLLLDISLWRCSKGQIKTNIKGQKILKKIFEVLCCILGTCTFLFLLHKSHCFLVTTENTLFYDWSFPRPTFVNFGVNISLAVSLFGVRAKSVDNLNYSSRPVVHH